MPKTLIQHLIRWVVSSGQFDPATNATLQAILDTEISPELVPARERRLEPSPPRAPRRRSARTSCRISTSITSPATASARARWPSWPGTPGATRTAATGRICCRRTSGTSMTCRTIKKWLEVFLYRFFKISQFKRSAIPNGPKVGSGGSLSPRGDWRAPSDSEAEVWLQGAAGKRPRLMLVGDIPIPERIAIRGKNLAPTDSQPLFQGGAVFFLARPASRYFFSLASASSIFLMYLAGSLLKSFTQLLQQNLSSRSSYL